MILKVALWPAPKLSGRLNPARPKPEPVTVAWETVIEEPPEFVRVAVCF